MASRKQALYAAAWLSGPLSAYVGGRLEAARKEPFAYPDIIRQFQKDVAFWTAFSAVFPPFGWLYMGSELGHPFWKRFVDAMPYPAERPPKRRDDK